MKQQATVTNSSRIRGGQLTLWAWLFAVVCLALGILWIRWGQQRALLPLLVGTTPLQGVGLGGSTGVVFALLAWPLFWRVPSLRGVLHHLREMLALETLNPGNITLIALSAGVGEEVLFRGVLQYHLGLWWTALLFGLAHPLSLAYIAYAALAGLVLGGLVELTGGLLPAIVCHTVVDAILLYKLKTMDDRR